MVEKFGVVQHHFARVSNATVVSHCGWELLQVGCFVVDQMHHRLEPTPSPQRLDQYGDQDEGDGVNPIVCQGE